MNRIVSESKSVVVIPARYKSSRFPGKPLVTLLNKPMILWVAELSAKAVGRDNVYVATDDNRIAEIVNKEGYKFVMTSEKALTGTDRLAEAVTQIDADIYVNVQGDEPLLNPEDIRRIIEKKIQYPKYVINGYCHLSENEDPSNINIPKVITTEDERLVYMSRSPIPGFKEKGHKPVSYKKQVCIYAFNRDELNKFHKFGRKSELETFEDIEILRFLELGCSVLMVETNGGSLAVDTPDDVHKVEEALKRKSKDGV